MPVGSYPTRLYCSQGHFKELQYLVSTGAYPHTLTQSITALPIAPSVNAALLAELEAQPNSTVLQLFLRGPQSFLDLHFRLNRLIELRPLYIK